MDLAPHPPSSRFWPQRSHSCTDSPERTIGIARAWTAAGIILLARLDLRAANSLRNPVFVCIIAFYAYSLLVLLLLRKHRKWPSSTRLTLHCLDILFVATLGLLVRGSESALFLIFLFTLVASAQRWGPRHLLTTASAVAALFTGELLLSGSLTLGVTQEAVRPGAAYVSLATFVVFATGLLWELTKTDAAERWESSVRAAQRVRAQISRDLHDSLMQSLYSMEYQIESLRSRTPGMSLDLSEDLARIHRIVRSGQVEIREIVQQGRPLDLGPKSLVEYVADMAVEFEQDTGIRVRFDSKGAQALPRPEIAGEVVRIVQEALLNIKKHSGARNVSIGFSAAHGQWRLRIDDDGRGFDFAGRLSMLELEANGQGPYVIRDRVATLGGELEIESTPERGARLEIALPKDDLA
jgi:signal transduction histidine kinase